MAMAGFKEKYLGEFRRLLEQAYEQRSIQTSVSSQNITVTINIPRDKTPEQEELLRTLTQIHTIPP